MRSWACIRARTGAAAVAVCLIGFVLRAAPAVSARAADEPKQDVSPAGVRVVADVAYGPDPRNVMDLYLPEGPSAPRALVVCIHGGGWAGGDKRVYGWIAEGLARKGYAAASVTYRFAPRWRAPAQMDDVQRAVRWLRKNAERYNVDPARFGAIGGSAGGHLASCLALADTRDNSDAELAAYSSRVQCAVDCYGPVDLEAMMRSASAPIVESFIGEPLEGNGDAYRAASPHFLVKQNPPPFLIIHGTRDVGTARGQVPMEQSEKFHEALRRAGGDATLLKIDGAGHGFTGRGTSKHAQEAFAAAARFFDQHLAGPARPGGAGAPVKSAVDDEGFRPIFDGKSLDGWETVDPSYWSVVDGAITGTITPDHPLRDNRYLVWKGRDDAPAGRLADFELKLKSRVRGEGAINNGFQFRSRLLPNGWDVAGYQVDNNLNVGGVSPWLVRLYDEHGRHDLALRGQRVTFGADGRPMREEIREAAGEPWFRLGEWHEYHLTCAGNRITLKVDGRLAAEVIDNDPAQFDAAGILALQLHSGPPTVAQFKDIRLNVLKPSATVEP